MTATVRPVPPDEHDDFDAYLADEGGDFLQSTAWAEVKAAMGWIPHHLWIERNGRRRGAATVLERRLRFGMSFLYAPRGPAIPAEPDLWEAFARHARRIGRGLWLKIDPGVPSDPRFEGLLLRSGFQRAPVQNPFGGVQPRRVCHVDLTRTPLFEGLPGKTRYNVRLARRRGVRIREGSLGDLPAFLDLLDETGARDGFTPRPRRYYEAVWRALNRRGLAEILLAERDGALLAAAWIVHFGRRAVYLYGASASRLRHMMGSYLVQWEAIRRSRRRGALVYDMGGVPLEGMGPTAGLLMFKGRFGSTIDLLGDYDLPLSPLYRLARAALPVLGAVRRRPFGPPVPRPVL